MTTKNFHNVNRRGWNRLAKLGCEWTEPVGPDQLARARELLSPEGWIPWDRIRRVLCLAAGGGQQAVLFAHLGYDVTLLDLSPNQLAADRTAARRYGLKLELIEGEMEDLRVLAGRDFDLVYQPVSAVYTPDVRRMYREIGTVLKPGGFYQVEHWNSIYFQMPEQGEWDGEAYRIVHPQQGNRGVPIPQTSRKIDNTEIACTTWQFIHPLGDLLGGLCDAGFLITHFREATRGNLAAAPATPEHLAAYLPPDFLVMAQKTS